MQASITVMNTNFWGQSRGKVVWVQCWTSTFICYAINTNKKCPWLFWLKEHRLTTDADAAHLGVRHIPWRRFQLFCCSWAVNYQELCHMFGPNAEHCRDKDIVKKKDSTQGVKNGKKDIIYSTKCGVDLHSCRRLAPTYLLPGPRSSSFLHH